ncbi:hypothetical protein MHY1_01424 [Methylovirgula sp. HY1]|nr:hypothetical protein MHY1_01424 [Methylovirgula sp. HY1]
MTLTASLPDGGLGKSYALCTLNELEHHGKCGLAIFNSRF